MVDIYKGDDNKDDGSYIKIDDIDILKVGLQTLRSRLSIIP